MSRHPSNDPGHVGPRIEPSWLDLGRQIILFVLGVWLVWHAAVSTGHDVVFLVTGLFLFGMIPFEQGVDALRRRRERGTPTE